jgi:hypothetical protein
MTALLVTISIIMAMIGAATTPLMTALQTSSRIGPIGVNPKPNPIAVAPEMMV